MTKIHKWLLIALATVASASVAGCETDDDTHVVGVAQSEAGESAMVVSMDSLGSAPLATSKGIGGVIVVDVSVLRVEATVNSDFDVVAAFVDGKDAELQGNRFALALQLKGGAQTLVVEALLSDGSRLAYEWQVVSPDELRTFGYEVVMPESVTAGRVFDVDCLSILDEGVAQDVGVDTRVSFDSPELVQEVAEGSYVVEHAGSLEVRCEAVSREDVGAAVIEVLPDGASETHARAGGERAVEVIAGEMIDVDCYGKDEFANPSARHGGLEVSPNIAGTYAITGQSVEFFRAGAIEVRCAPLRPRGETRALAVTVRPDRSSGTLAVSGISPEETIGVGERVVVRLLAVDQFGNLLGRAAIEEIEIATLRGDAWVPDSNDSFESDGEGGARFSPRVPGRYRGSFAGSPMGGEFEIGAPWVEIEWNVEEDAGSSLVPDDAYRVEYRDEGLALRPVCVSPVHALVYSRDELEREAGGRRHMGEVVRYDHDLWNVGRLTEVMVLNQEERLPARSFEVCDEDGVCLGRDADSLDCGDLQAAIDENVPGRRCRVSGEFLTREGQNLLEIVYQHSDPLTGDSRWSTLACANGAFTEWEDTVRRTDYVEDRQAGEIVSETRLYQGAFSQPGNPDAWTAATPLAAYVQSATTWANLSLDVRESYPGFGRIRPDRPEDASAAISLSGAPGLGFRATNLDEIVVSLGSVDLDFGGGKNAYDQSSYCYTAELSNFRIAFDAELWGAPNQYPRVTIADPLSEDGGPTEGLRVGYDFDESRHWDRHGRRGVTCKYVHVGSERRRRVRQQAHRVARQFRAELEAVLANVAWSEVFREPAVSDYPMPTGEALTIEGYVANRLRAQFSGAPSELAVGLLRHSVSPQGTVSVDGTSTAQATYRGAQWRESYVPPDELLMSRDDNDPVLRNGLSRPRALRERAELVSGVPVVRYVAPVETAGQLATVTELQQLNTVLDGVWRLGGFHEALLSKRSTDEFTVDPASTRFDVSVSLENPPRFDVDRNGNLELEITGAYVRITPTVVRSGALRAALELFGPIELRVSHRVNVGVESQSTAGGRVEFVRSARGLLEVVTLGSNHWTSLELLTQELDAQLSAELHSGNVDGFEQWLVEYVSDAILDYATQSLGGADTRLIEFGSGEEEILIETNLASDVNYVSTEPGAASLASQMSLFRLLSWPEYE